MAQSYTILPQFNARCIIKTMQIPQLEKSWNSPLKNELQAPYMNELANFLAHEREQNTIYPPQEAVFKAFSLPFDQVKVVIIGQDPYHGPNQACGLSFSVPRGVKQPPSLKNIFKELKQDLGLELPETGSLEPWVNQGVLLLNAILTVRKGAPKSHHKQGWERFTDGVVKALNERKDPPVFVLWGKSAQAKCENIQLHNVLSAPHPSPYSAHSGFFGCKHFSKINAILHKQGKEPIDWRVEP